MQDVCKALKESCKPLLKQQKLCQKPLPENDDVTKVIQVDSNVINYGKFICGKMLGSTLVITNTSNQEQIIDMSIDNSTEIYDCNDIYGPYNREELPFKYSDGATISNSEKIFKSWFIENPINKELVKHMTLRFGPKVEKEFIIVLKAPTNRIECSLTSFVTIKMANIRRT